MKKTMKTIVLLAVVAAVVYFEKHDVSYSEGIALYTIQYSIHKVSIALFALVLFISNWQYMVTRFHSYIALLFITFFITIVICVLVILLVLSPVFHKKILAFARWLNRRGRFERLVDRLEAEVSIMEGVSRRIIRDAKQVIYLVAVNFVKQFFWFAIPFLILSDGVLPLSLFQSLSVTSLAVMTAAVIPTPSGIGSLELIMTGLYSVIAGVDRAGAVLVLYRIATFFFPFFAGAVLVLLRRAVRKTKIRIKDWHLRASTDNGILIEDLQGWV